MPINMTVIGIFNAIIMVENATRKSRIEQNNDQNQPNMNSQTGAIASTIDLAVAIDPNNSNLVYVLGDNVAGGGEQDEPANNLRESALAIVRVNAATNTVSQISDDNNATGNTGNGSFVHADGRAFAFDANGRLLTSTDGGISAMTACLLKFSDLSVRILFLHTHSRIPDM